MALLGLLAVHAALAASTAEIPAKAFFENDQFAYVRVSPDGRHLALAGPIKDHPNRLQIDIVDLKTASVRAHYSLNGAVPDGIWWANNSQLLFTTDYRFGWFDQPIPSGQVWVMNINSGAVADLANNTTVQRVIYKDGGATGYVVMSGKGLMKFDEHAKYARNNNNVRGAFLSSCVPIHSSPSASGQEINDLHDGTFYYDNSGYARLWLGYNDFSYAPEMAYTNPCGNGLHWYDLTRFIVGEPRYMPRGPWLFTPDNRKFYYAGMTPAGTVGLYLVNALTWKKTLLYDDPHYDIESLFDSDSELLFSDDGERLLAFQYMAARPVWILLDRTAPPVMLLEKLEQQFAGENVVIVSRSLDGRLTVFFVSSDRNPWEYYLYNAKSQTEVLLFRALPGIDPNAMAPMQPIKFKARDGMTIHGYLTLPLGKSKNLPMIVIPHGGPYGLRDNWGFDPEAQYFAYHGYAVLQVEYRGSGGYGYAFQKAGYRQWGGAMQNDLTDGTRWAIKQGIADPGRICIYGGSYGGYAALEGAVEEPDLYKCAVGYAGVYDLVSFRSRFHTLHYESEIPAITTELGNDEAYLRAHSPVFNAGKIKAALFLAHGGEDKSVPVDQADELRDALDKIHKPYIWLYYRNESHGFYKLDHRVTLYTKMLAFFDKYIGQPAA